MNISHPLNGILSFTAITPLHPGAGSGMGLIDNPIIRERATGFPFIQAPSVKGVLRAKAEEIWGSTNLNKTVCLFGPERSSTLAHEGALVLNDARILAMPVRSFKGLFVWLTSPQVLYRFFRDFSMTGLNLVENDDKNSGWDYMKWLIGIQGRLNGRALVPKGAYTKICIKDDSNNTPTYNLFIEEYQFPADEDDKLALFANYLSKTFMRDQYMQALIKTNLVVLDDEHFRYFVEHATQVEANIAIDQNSGTTTKGSLRYTEFLPEQTLLYCSCRLSKKDYSSGNVNTSRAFNELMGKIDFLQIGGDSTTGKGFIMVKTVVPDEKKEQNTETSQSLEKNESNITGLDSPGDEPDEIGKG